MIKFTKKSPFTNQHIVPKFLLKKWCNNHGEICRFRYCYKGFEADWKSPSSVGYKKELLNFHSRTDLPKHYMESKVFGPIYDNEGGVILDILLTSGLEGLTQGQEESWSRFIASLLVRMPEIIDSKLRKQGDYLRILVNESQVDYENLKSINDPDKIIDFMDKVYPGYADDIGITLMPNIIDLIAARIMEEMEWSIVNITLAPHPFLIGDRPLILTADTTKQSCIIALPISPRQVFLASRPSKEWSILMKTSHKKLVKAINHEIVTRASRDVYSSDDSQILFVKNHLKRNLASKVALV